MGSPHTSVRSTFLFVGTFFADSGPTIQRRQFCLDRGVRGRRFLGQIDVDMPGAGEKTNSPLRWGALPGRRGTTPSLTQTN